MGRGEVGDAALGEAHARPRQQGLRGAPRLARGVDADDRYRRYRAKPVLEGRGHLVQIGRRQTTGAGDQHPVGRLLRQFDLREIGDHIGQDVGGGIADLVQGLLGDGARRDQPAGLIGLCQDEAAIGPALGDRIADIMPVRHLLPIRIETAGALRTAFQEVADQAAGRQPVIIGVGPFELMHQDPERKRAVGATSGDHDVGAMVERAFDRQRAEIGIGCQKPGWQGQPGDVLANALSAQLLGHRQQVVAFDRGNRKLEPEFGAYRLQRRLATGWIDAAGVADNTDLAPAEFRQTFAQIGDEIRREAGRRILHPGSRQQRHRHLGEIIHHQIID